MKIKINIGSDHCLTDEQFESINDELQELADEAVVDFSAEDHSTNDGGDYYFIFKDDTGMELEDFCSFIYEIRQTILSGLKQEVDDWWMTFE